jgi:hypothetical protein
VIGASVSRYVPLFIGVLLILPGADIALASSRGYRRCRNTLPVRDARSGYSVVSGTVSGPAIAAPGAALAADVLVTGHWTNEPFGQIEKL